MSPRLHVVLLTTAARARHAARTASTLAPHHPDSPVEVVVVDDRYGEVSRSQSGWRPLRPDDVGGAPRRLAELALLHAPQQRLAAVRPAVVARVAASAREAGAEVVLVVPDDAEVLAPLDGLAQLAHENGVALVPVRNATVPRDGRLPDPVDHLHDGRMDRDLFAVSTVRGAAFLAWWEEAMAEGRYDDPARFDPVDHPWLDDAFLIHRAALLAHGAVRSYRNLDETGDLDRAAPARALVVRLPGFDPTRPWMLSERAGLWPRVLLSEHPLLHRLASARTAAVGAGPGSAAEPLADPYARLANGHLVDPPMRLLYRRALLDARRHRLPEPPNPFVPGEQAAFDAWLAEPGPDGLPRHLRALRDARPDLARQFASDDGALVAWAQRDAARGGVWTPVPSALSAVAPRMATAATRATAEPSGVNLIGLLSAQLGVGEHARLAARSFRDARVPFAVVDHDDTVNERDPGLLRDLGATGTGCRYDVDLVLVNADQTRRALDRYDRPGRRGRPTLAVWAWEVCTFPERMHAAFDDVDEVWVLSDFVRAALAPAAAEHGVQVLRFPIQLPTVRPPVDRSVTGPLVATLGLDPQRPYFLFSFDYFSVAERKQPWAAVQAFVRAFPQPMPGGPLLVIKSINGAFFPVDRERLLHATAGRPDVVLVESYLPADVRDALVRHASAYVSLHRSEGLGLTLAEAMALGTPCIATNWSGNLEFMTPENSWLVDASLQPIDVATPVYAGLGDWASPDLDAAAGALRQVLDDPTAARTRAERAQADLAARNAGGADVRFVLERLRAVRDAHGGRMVG